MMLFRMIGGAVLVAASGASTRLALAVGPDLCDLLVGDDQTAERTGSQPK